MRRTFSTKAPGRLKHLRQVLASEKWHIAGASVAITATSAGTVSFPYFMGNLMDGFAASSGSPEAWLEIIHSNTTACVGALALVGLGGFVRAYLLETASEKINKRLRLELFQSLLRKPMTYFDSSRTGDLVSRLGSDVTRVSRSIMDGASGLRVVINAAAGTVMVAKTVPLAIVPQLLAPVVAMFVGGVVYGKIVRGIARNQSEAQSKAMQVAEENLSLVRIVKLFNAEQRAIQDYQKGLDRVYELAQSNALATGGKVMTFVTIGGGFILHVIYQCGFLISSGTLTLGQTAALAGYLLVCGNAYQGLVTSYGDIQKALGACERVMTMMKTPDTVNEVCKKTPKFWPIIFDSAPSLTMKNVSFTHSGNVDVLRGINMFVPGGAKQAIVGLSGCGKSTILSLLAKLYKPTGGRILLNGSVDYSEVDPHQLRQNLVAFVPQDTALFNDSVRRNVWYPLEPKTASGLEKEISRSTRLDFVNDWDAPVGERGQNLSGGERQRIAIARALSKQKPLLLLDEATSALDSESDSIILKNLKSLDSTILAVTHRRSAIEWSDRLTVLADGRVEQEGDTRELLLKPGPVLQRLLLNIARSSE
jgi:ABC-type multidrug transport system fused ATPase/permease subunit